MKQKQILIRYVSDNTCKSKLIFNNAKPIVICKILNYVSVAILLISLVQNDLLIIFYVQLKLGIF